MWTSAQEEGNGKDISTLMSTSAAFGKVRSGEAAHTPSVFAEKEEAAGV